MVKISIVRIINVYKYKEVYSVLILYEVDIIYLFCEII